MICATRRIRRYGPNGDSQGTSRKISPSLAAASKMAPTVLKQEGYVLENIAVDDEVSVAFSGVGDHRHVLCQQSPRNIVHEGLCSIDKACNEISVVSAMV